MKTHLFQRLGLAILIVGLAIAAYCPNCRSQGTPFNGFEFALPATIECEQFNRGGLNVAYSALDGLLDTKYREEAVAIYRCSDYDNGSVGYNQLFVTIMNQVTTPSISGMVFAK